MKKITLLLALLVSTYGFAQSTISFETSEGYTLGDINGQNGWTVTGDGSGGFVENQDVSNDMATDGVNSFKIQADSRFGVQQNPIVGGFYAYSPMNNFDGASFTADVYMSELNTTKFRLATANTVAQTFTSVIQFDPDGIIRVLEVGGWSNTGATWVNNTWYEVQIATDATTVKYFIDGVEIYSGPALAAENVDQLRFVHDNGGGFAYMDNLITVDGVLSTVNPTLEQVSIYPNPASDVINVKVPANVQITGASLYDVLGKNTGVSISNGQINVAHLSRGVYMLSLETSAGSMVKKIIKQ